MSERQEPTTNGTPRINVSICAPMVVPRGNYRTVLEMLSAAMELRREAVREDFWAVLHGGAK